MFPVSAPAGYAKEMDKPEQDNKFAKIVAQHSSSAGAKGEQLATFAPRDTVPPTVAITGPLSGSSLAGRTRVSAAAADNYGVASVQFMVDGANVGSRLLSPPFAFTWQTTTVSNGLHTLTAVATDTAGLSTVSLPVTVTVANSDLVLHLDFETYFAGGIVSDVSGYGNFGIRYSLAHWPTDATIHTSRGCRSSNAPTIRRRCRCSWSRASPTTPW
jgi:hypothetical protein